MALDGASDQMALPCTVGSICHPLRAGKGHRGVFYKLTNWKWTEEPIRYLSPLTGNFIHLSIKMPEQVGT